MSRPNVLYLHTHDAGRYVQPFGHATPTPNIQRLAEEGILFRQTYCAGPTCSPSRAAMLTGMSAHSSGMIGLAHRGFRLNDYSQHLVTTMKNAGYHTALSGTQHEVDGKDVADIGYDEILANGSTEDKAARWLADPPKAPFFLSVGFNDTHRAFLDPGEPEDERYCMPPPGLPDTPETRRDMACYKASARVLDQKFGVVLDALEKNGLSENTIVLCTTDHGVAFPGMKCNLTDHGIGVFLIMRGPGGFTGGKVVDALISQVDVFPTLCDVLGIDPPAWLEGRSFMPVVRGEVEEINDEIYSDVTFHAAYEPQRCIRTKRWKYIRRWGDRKTPVLPNCDDSLSKTLWMEHGWKERVLGDEQLYDLVFDPQETCNLVGKPEVEETLNDLRGRLDAWMKRTNDPLLKGWVDPPKGSAVNDAAGDSPSEPPVRY